MLADTRFIQIREFLWCETRRDFNPCALVKRIEIGEPIFGEKFEDRKAALAAEEPILTVK